MADDIMAAVADELAQQALEIWEVTKDDDIFDQVTKIIGTSSQTLEEAFKTAVRVRRAEKRAREMLAQEKAKLAGRG